jgi:signal transduction histidine kinase
VAAPRALIVSGDADRLREALDNLVSNAVKSALRAAPSR